MKLFFQISKARIILKSAIKQKQKKEQSNVLENQGLTKKPQNIVDKLSETYYI